MKSLRMRPFGIFQLQNITCSNHNYFTSFKHSSSSCPQIYAAPYSRTLASCTWWPTVLTTFMASDLFKSSFNDSALRLSWGSRVLSVYRSLFCYWFLCGSLVSLWTACVSGKPVTEKRISSWWGARRPCNAESPKTDSTKSLTSKSLQEKASIQVLVPPCS